MSLSCIRVDFESSLSCIRVEFESKLSRIQFEFESSSSQVLVKFKLRQTQVQIEVEFKVLDFIGESKRTIYKQALIISATVKHEIFLLLMCLTLRMCF